MRMQNLHRPSFNEVLGLKLTNEEDLKRNLLSEPTSNVSENEGNQRAVKAESIRRSERNLKSSRMPPGKRTGEVSQQSTIAPPSGAGPDAHTDGKSDYAIPPS